MRTQISRNALLTMPSLKGSCVDESLLIREYALYHCSPLDMFSLEHPVGPGRVDAPSVSAKIDRMWARITRRRIDCVIWRSFYAAVIEAKVHARMPAVTQLLRNAELLAGDHPELSTIMPILLCRTADLGVERRLEQAGAYLVLMPALGQPAEAV